MRARLLASALLIGCLPGCGDGVGRPIVSSEPAPAGTSGLGAAGAGGIPGTAGGVGGLGAGGTDAGGTSAAGTNPGGTSAGGTSAAGPGLGGPGAEGPDAGGPGDVDLDSQWDDWVGGRDPEPGGEDPMNAVPRGTHCEPVLNWDRASAEAEQELFRFLNFARESGLECASEVAGPLPPLRMQPELRCSARLHARDMRERGFFERVNPDGVGPEDRMRRAGASFAVASESIARDPEMAEPEVPYQAIAELFAAGGSDCRNLVEPRFESVGIGVFQGLWTLDFTGP